MTRPATPSLAPSAVSAELDINGSTAFAVDDGVPKSGAELHLETAQGAERARTVGKFPADGKAGTLTFEVPVAT